MSVQNVATNNDLRPAVAQTGAAAAGTYGQIRAISWGAILAGAAAAASLPLILLIRGTGLGVGHHYATSAKVAADKARKAFAYSVLWLFVSPLIGAFFASLAAV